MPRHPPRSFARVYSTVISPRPSGFKKTSCIASSSALASKRISGRFFGAGPASGTAMGQSYYSSLQENRCSMRTSYIETSVSQPPRLLFTYIPVRHSSNGNETQVIKNDKGAESYELATEALRNASRAKRKREERLMREQYDAMDAQRNRTKQRERRRGEERARDPRLQKLNYSAPENEAKDRAAGVAVVRTIVKQSQPKTDLRASSDAEAKGGMDDEERWLRTAERHMEEAAFQHGHPSALVRLGNEALDRHGASSSSSSSSSPGSPIVDRDRCREWIDESPLDLAAVLELCTDGDVWHSRGTADGVVDLGTEGSPSSPYLRLALRLYEEGGERGSAEGWYNLGHLLWDMQDDALDCSTKQKAMDAFYKAMELGDADAIYFVASHYLSYEESEVEEVSSDASMLLNTYDRYGPSFVSPLLPQNSESLPASKRPDIFSFANELQRHGHELLRIAAHRHAHGPALHHLALLCLQNNFVEEFGRLLSRAADAGNADSLFLRGHCRYSGADGHDEDLRAALEDFVAAADRGHVDAMVSAGAVLHGGAVGEDGRVVVERDQQRAFDLYQRAGEAGSIEGWRNVVSCYATGQGVPKCMDTAKYIANTMLKEDGN